MFTSSRVSLTLKIFSSISRKHFNKNKTIQDHPHEHSQKCRGLFSEITEDEENFVEFYEGFGKNLKLVTHEDAQSCSKIDKFLRFFPTKVD